MAEQEYIVSTIRGVDISEIDAEMIASAGSETVPSRTVNIANARPVSKRQTHFMLTEEEAAALRNDPRIYSVELPPNPDRLFTMAKQDFGDFSKTTSDSGNYANWGLRRCISESNIYGSGNSYTGAYTYAIDGTGVDVVIQDSGLQVDHPEFIREDGTSRVQQIDWYAESGVSGTMSVNHYRDWDGHGTHVAGIAAGKTYGWAKGANVYSVKVSGLEGSGDSGGISIATGACFDVITGWHLNKPIDPVTGVRRPTIVNMSWGYGEYMYNVSGGNYRGTPWADSWSGIGRKTDVGMVGVYASLSLGYRHVVRDASVDVNIQEMIDAGIHVTIAAGNSYQKVDVVGGDDYNNYYTGGYFSGGGNVYYHRGGSPFDDEAMYVGNIDSAINGGGLEQKASSSENGPAITVWAPGTDIMSSCSTTNRFTSGDYPFDSNYKITNISGTSMAAPQVCGVGALHLQANPHLTPAQLKARIIADAKTDKVYTSGSDVDYANSRSINGSPNRFLYNRYNQERGVNFTGPISVNANLRS